MEIYLVIDLIDFFVSLEPNFQFCFHIKKYSFLQSDHENLNIKKTIYFQFPLTFDIIF
jgi:hypothetical protein